MKSTRTRQELITTGVILAALALLVMTLIVALRSDPDRFSRVQALLVSDNPMIVLHADPELSSGIAGVLKQRTRVTVVEFDPQDTPGWALVEGGGESGWVPLDRLDALP